MISYSGRRHSAATTSYRPPENEIAGVAESEASRRVSVGANLDQPSNSALSSRTKSKWSSESNVKPAFIVNNPATWRPPVKQEDDKKWQSQLVRKRRVGVPTSPLPQDEVQVLTNKPEKINLANSSAETEIPQPFLEVEPFDQDSAAGWQSEAVNPVLEASWNRLHSGEDDFKAWKSQIMNEIQTTKVVLDKKFEQIEAKKKKNVKKHVRIVSPEPIQEQDEEIDDINDMNTSEGEIKQQKIDAMVTKPLQDLDLAENDDEQIVPKWKKRPASKK